jgi:hypothetical protein
MWSWEVQEFAEKSPLRSSKIQTVGLFAAIMRMHRNFCTALRPLHRLQFVTDAIVFCCRGWPGGSGEWLLSTATGRQLPSSCERDNQDRDLDECHVNSRNGRLTAPDMPPYVTPCAWRSWQGAFPGEHGGTRIKRGSCRDLKNQPSLHSDNALHFYRTRLRHW